MKTQEPAVKISHLIFYRETQKILGPLCLTFKKSEIIAVTGQNGSGKTTFLKLLAGLLKPSSGTISLNANPHYMSHILPLDPRLTTHQNLEFLGGNTDEFDDVPLLSLSQGQQKKLFLSYFTSQQDNKIWLMDEPFTHLDQEAVITLSAQIKKHQKAGGVIIFTHHGDLPFPTDHHVKL